MAVFIVLWINRPVVGNALSNRLTMALDNLTNVSVTIRKLVRRLSLLCTRRSRNRGQRSGREGLSNNIGGSARPTANCTQCVDGGSRPLSPSRQGSVAPSRSRRVTDCITPSITRAPVSGLQIAAGVQGNNDVTNSVPLPGTRRRCGISNFDGSLARSEARVCAVSSTLR